MRCNMTVLTETTNDELLNDRQFAAYCDLAERTPAVWRVRGDGPPYIRIGSNILYRRSDVDAWLEERTVRPTVTA